MKKKLSVLTAAALCLSMALAGCGAGANETTAASSAAESGADGSASAETTGEAAEASSEAAEGGDTADGSAVRVGSLKGPTSMGLVELMDRAGKGETENSYEFTMAGKADELVGKVAEGDLDVALLPANVASVLYNKTKGGVKVIDINTLGVLYVVASDESITSMADLKGKTVYMTGKGTTPEYVVNYLLAQNGLSAADVDLQFKSEATEVASVLKEDPSAVGILPQPFATAATIQNESLKTVVDLTEEWDKFNQDSGSMLVTGVTIVRSQFLEENETAVAAFLSDHEQSAAYVTDEANADAAAELIAAQGIVEKAPIAKKALPYCNIVCMTGDAMKGALSGYLNVLFEQDPKSVGGELPGDDFYYLP